MTVTTNLLGSMIPDVDVCFQLGTGGLNITITEWNSDFSLSYNMRVGSSDALASGRSVYSNENQRL